MTAAKNIVVADSAKLPDHLAGYVTFWSSGGDVEDYDALANAWEAAGLLEELLLEPASPKVACRLAVQSVCRGNKNRFRRPKKGGGWIVVDQQDGQSEDDVDFDVQSAFSVDVVGRLTGDDTHPLWDRVKEEYERRLDIVSGADVGQWLTGPVMRYLHASTLRERSGVYFVNRDNALTWDAIVGIVRQYTPHHIIKMKAVDTDTDLITEVLRELTTEVERFVTGIQEDLDEAELTARGWNTRQARCEHMTRKLESFRSILGSGLDSLVKQIEDVEAEAVAASLMALEGE